MGTPKRVPLILGNPQYSVTSPIDFLLKGDYATESQSPGVFRIPKAWKEVSELNIKRPSEAAVAVAEGLVV